MKDVVAIIVLLAIITAIVFGFERWQAAGNQPQDDPRNLEYIDIFTMPITEASSGKEVQIPALAFRMSNAVHIMKIQSINGMTWIDTNSPEYKNKIVRHSINLGARTLEHDIDFDSFIEVLRQHSQEIKENRLPTLIEMYDEWVERGIGPAKK